MPDPLPALEQVSVDVDGGVGRLVLDRPAKLNALSRRVLSEIVAGARWLDEHPAVRAVVVAGSGRAFSAGFDLTEMGRDPGADPVVAADAGRVAADALGEVRVPTIAAVQGACVGGGVVLAAACDLRIAAAGARFSIPEVDLGMPLGWGGIPRLVRLVGPATALDLVLTCRVVEADEARALGLVSRVVPDDRLGAEVDAVAAAVAARPRHAVAATVDRVRAAAEALASTRGAATDAYTLAAALADPEAREAARRYLADRRVRRDP